MSDIPDIFGISMEIDEALLGVPAEGGGDLEVGNLPALL
jgi:hypothetical protein